MWAWLSAFLLGLVQAVPTISKYFPPKATETTIEDDQAAIDKQIAAEQSTGRPSA